MGKIRKYRRYNKDEGYLFLYYEGDLPNSIFLPNLNLIIDEPNIYARKATGLILAEKNRDYFAVLIGHYNPLVDKIASIVFPIELAIFGIFILVWAFSSALYSVEVVWVRSLVLLSIKGIIFTLLLMFITFLIFLFYGYLYQSKFRKFIMELEAEIDNKFKNIEPLEFSDKISSVLAKLKDEYTHLTKK